MTNHIKILVCGAAAIAMTACGPSASYDEDYVNSGETIPYDDAVALRDRIEDSADAVEADLPANATMNGYVAIDIDDYSIAVGNASMHADFDDAEISGGVGSVVLLEEVGDEFETIVDFDGNLDIDGDIDGVSFTGSITGDLAATQDVFVEEDEDTGEDVYGQLDVSANIDMVDGAFGVDADGRMVADANLEGEMIGTISVDGEVVSVDPTDVEGVIRVGE